MIEIEDKEEKFRPAIFDLDDIEDVEDDLVLLPPKKRDYHSPVKPKEEKKFPQDKEESSDSTVPLGSLPLPTEEVLHPPHLTYPWPHLSS